MKYKKKIANLDARIRSWENSEKKKGNHEHHKPGSVNK